jgi:hypothetical protein
MSEYKPVDYGDAVEFSKRDEFWIGCCDCGLVHRYKVKIVGNKVQLIMWRDNRATGQRRRYLRRKQEETWQSQKRKPKKL